MDDFTDFVTNEFHTHLVLSDGTHITITTDDFDKFLDLQAAVQEVEAAYLELYAEDEDEAEWEEE
jgi:hypothetical protein